MNKLLAISTACLSIISCKKTDNVAVDQQFEVQEQRTVVVALPASKPQIRVAKITDSRCPVGVQCIWAGQAAVDVALSTGPDSARVNGLYLGQGLGPGTGWHTRDSAAVTLAGVPYWLHLLAVDPYPSRNGTGRKTATFRLTIR